MKRLLAALLFLAPILAFSAPTTLKEVFAQEATWKIAPPSGDLLSSDWRKAQVKESASALISRIANARSDSERKAAAFIAQANRALLAPVLAAAEQVDVSKTKSLRAALDRIAASKSAAPADQAEVAKVLAALR